MTAARRTASPARPGAARRAEPVAPDPAWMNEAFAAFADDVLSSQDFERRVDEVVAEKLAPFQDEVEKLRVELASTQEKLAALVSLPDEVGELRTAVDAVEGDLADFAEEWISANPHTPSPADAGNPLSPTPLLQRGQERVLSGAGRGTAPTTRLRVIFCLVGGGLLIAALAPSLASVADAAPAHVTTTVPVPVAGTSDAPIPVDAVAVHPANDAKFPATTTTR